MEVAPPYLSLGSISIDDQSCYMLAKLHPGYEAELVARIVAALKAELAKSGQEMTPVHHVEPEVGGWPDVGGDIP